VSHNGGHCAYIAIEKVGDDYYAHEINSGDGIVASQRESLGEGGEHQKDKGNEFSVLRGHADGDYYPMPDVTYTPCLSSRFMDFLDATRVIGSIFGDGKKDISVGKYDKGCPFFKDRQREFLLMPWGLEAEICAVLASAEDPTHAYVLAKTSDYDDSQKEEVQLNEISAGKMRNQVDFCQWAQNGKERQQKVSAVLADHKIVNQKKQQSRRKAKSGSAKCRKARKEACGLLAPFNG
jgi:hypothetical protein